MTPSAATTTVAVAIRRRRSLRGAASAVSPIPVPVRAAGEAGVARKVEPWKLSRASFYDIVEEARAAAAALIGAQPGDIAIVGSASYGHSTHMLFSHFVEKILPKNAYDSQLLQRLKTDPPVVREKPVKAPPLLHAKA